MFEPDMELVASSPARNCRMNFHMTPIALCELSAHRGHALLRQSLGGQALNLLFPQ